MYPKELEMTIEVTQDDIDRGEQTEPTSCAIARALSRRFDTSICVKPRSVWIDGFWARWPKPIQDFIIRFDCDKRQVRPFSFRLPKLRPGAWIKRQWEEQKKAAEPTPSKEEIDAFLDSLSAGNDKPSDVLISS